MSELKVQGRIIEIGEVVTSKEGAAKPWKKLVFVVQTSEQYNNLYPIEVFGADRVDNFLKFQKVGQDVECLFNVNGNKHNERWFTSLSMWRVNIIGGDAGTASSTAAQRGTDDNLPF